MLASHNGAVCYRLHCVLGAGVVARHDGEEVPRFIQQEEEGEEREEGQGEEEMRRGRNERVLE